MAETVGPGPSFSSSPDDYKPRRSSHLLVGCAVTLVGSVLIASCGGLIVGVYWIGARVAAENAPLDVGPRKPLAQDRSQIAPLLDGAWSVPDDDPRAAPVRKLLQELEQARDGDAGAFETLIDWPAHIERYCSAYRDPISRQTRAELDAIAREDFSMPLEASDFKIAKIRELTSDEWHVFAYAQGGQLAHVPYLFHVRRHGLAWKLVDWAEVPEMCWKSEQGALAAGPLYGDLAREEQIRLVEDVVEGNAKHASAATEEAADLLRRAEGRFAVRELQDANLHLIAVHWYRFGKPAEAQRVLDRVSDRDSFPWAHHLAALLHYEAGRHAEALAAIERYERAAGFYFDVALTKVHCHAALKDKGAAEAAALTLIRHAPDDQQALNAVLEHVTAEKLPAALAALPQTPETVERLAATARLLLYREREDQFRQVRDVAAKIDPASRHVLELDAQWLHYRGDLEGALAVWQQLIDQASDPGERSLALSNHLSLSVEFRPAEAVYQAANDPRATLESMTEGIEYGEAMIGLPLLEKLLPLHRQRDPADPRLPWYEAQVAVHREDWNAAVKLLNEAIAAHRQQQEDNAPDDTDYVLQSLHSQLADARYELGQGLDVYREADDKDEAFQSLAASLEGDHDWDTLKQLLSEHAARPGDFWRDYYSLRWQEQQARQSGNQAQLSVILAGYQALAKDNAERAAANMSAEIYPFLLDRRIDMLASAAEDWRAPLAAHREPARLFDSLARRFRREQNDAALRELETIARERFPTAPAFRRHELERLWQQEDYAGIVASVAREPKEPSDIDYTLREQLLISHLATGDTAAAWKLASEPAPRVREQWLVRMAEGNTAGVKALLAEHADELYSPLAPASDDWRVPAVGRYVQSDEFRRLRKEFALPFSSDYLSTYARVFYPDDVSWTEESIRARLDAVGLEEVAVKLLAQPPLVTKTFRLRRGETTCLLTCDDKPYITVAGLEKLRYLDPSFKSAVAGHRQWVTLELERGAGQASDSLWMTMVAALLPDALALHAALPGGDMVQTAVTPAWGKELKASPSQLMARGFPASDGGWYFFSDSEEEEAEETPARKWYGRCTAITQGTAVPGRVQVRINHGAAIEEHWLAVETVRHEHWGNFIVEAPLPRDSELNPLYRAGDRIRLSTHEIQAWED